jgi:acyl CoA:acetate/3-ketoacid CoA transferase alpha subunit
MKTIAIREAVAMIPDGASLMIGGFMGCGTPEPLMHELVRQGKRGLTVIANDTATPGVGIGKPGVIHVRKIEIQLARPGAAVRVGLDGYVDEG